MVELWNRLSERQKKLFGWLALLALGGMALLVLQPAPTPPVPVQQVSGEARGEILEKVWEKELIEILNSLLGGRRSQVFLTLERGPKLNIAYNITEEERRTGEGGVELRRTSTPIILRNDAERREQPLVLEEIEPVVRGVLVVLDCEPDIELRLKVAQAVATALQVPMYRIEVLFKQ